MAEQSLKPPAARINRWDAASLAAKPRLLSTVQMAPVRDKRRDLDDELRRLALRERESRR